MKPLLLSIALLSVSTFAPGDIVAGGSGGAEVSRRDRPMSVSVKTWGPTEADLERARIRVESSKEFKQRTQGVRWRLTAFEQVENGSAPPVRYRIHYYDYSRDKAFIAESDYAGRTRITFRESDEIPGVSEEEIRDAYDIVRKSPLFGESAAAGRTELFEAMPPYTMVNGERLVNIGLMDYSTGRNEIVGVSFKNSKAVAYPNNAPPEAIVSSTSCGIASAGQGSTGPGLTGSYQLTVNGSDGQALWEMLVVRPSASSGRSFERSGLEIRDVKYRGKSVLKRGHVPVLNVEYDNNQCGPYRDWQYAEGFFSVPSTGVTYPNGTTGGIALLPPGTVARTVVETRNDSGNFRGVAVYQEVTEFGNELVLVTELEAGWYRYVMEWRFAEDGTIRPTFSFGSIANSCVCVGRIHHVYWRLDFDIVQAANDVFVMERNNKFLTQISTEELLFKNFNLNRRLLIQNSNGTEAYQLIPGSNDGMVLSPGRNVMRDPFGIGDFWVLRYAGTDTTPTELDDPNPSGDVKAAISAWLNNQSTVGQNIVIWYAAHQRKTDDANLTEWRENVVTGKHVVGPIIKPVRW